MSLLLAVGILGAMIAPAQAQFIPPDRGLPGRREGGGTRGECAVRPLEGERPSTLVALVPDTNFGVTVDPAPTLYWFVPAVNAQLLEFVIFDESDTEVYRAELPPQTDTGIVSITIPPLSDQSPTSRLQPRQDYHWYFSIVCDELDRSGDIFSEGWLRRIEPGAALAQALAAAPTEQHSNLYAEAGLWHDALHHTAQHLCQPSPSPQAQTQWNRLLESVNLASLSTASLDPVCEQ